jgi:hypothetical protein
MRFLGRLTASHGPSGEAAGKRSGKRSLSASRGKRSGKRSRAITMSSGIERSPVWEAVGSARILPYLCNHFPRFPRL